MGTPLQAQAELSNDPLSQLSPQDITDLGTEDANFLRQLAVVFDSGGSAATRWSIHAVRDHAGMPHGMGKLDTLVAQKKMFYFVARRKVSDNPETFEEFVVKAERTGDDPASVLPPDDPKCGFVWDPVRHQYVWVCTS